MVLILVSGNEADGIDPGVWNEADGIDPSVWE